MSNPLSPSSSYDSIKELREVKRKLELEESVVNIIGKIDYVIACLKVIGTKETKCFYQ